MQTAFSRPYPARAIEPDAVPAWKLNRRDNGQVSGRVSLIVVAVYFIASIAILAAGLTQSA